MTEEKRAKVLISIADGRIELEGSEDFVEKQLASFSEFIKEAIQHASTPRKAHIENNEVKAKTNSSATGLDSYDLVFAEADGKIQILKDIPGSSVAQKMANAARLLALGNTLINKPTTAFQEIRELCVAHGCLDSGNFSSTIKEEKSDFIFGGGPKSQTIQLSKPGRTAAEKLATELNK